MSHPRTRMAAVAGGVALSMSLAFAPAAVAQDGPEATIEGFMGAVMASDFEALPGFFCEAEAAQAAQFDVSDLADEMPEGLDVSALLDAFVFEVDLESTEVVSQTEDEAVVRVVGSVAIDLDREATVPFVEAIIEMSGMEVDEAAVDMFMTIVTSEFETQAQRIDADVTLVPGESGWLICSALEFGSPEVVSEEMPDDGMPDEDTGDDDTDADVEAAEAAAEDDGS